MKDLDKVRISYKLEPTYGGKWAIRIFTVQEVGSAEEGLNMIKSMYMLEDPDSVNPSIEVVGIDAVDLLLGLEK